MKTQAEAIYDYMTEHGSITPLEAMREIGCFRLSARIWDLRKEGVKIKQETKTVKNRSGSTSHYAVYSIAE